MKCIKCGRDESPKYRCDACGEASCSECWTKASGPLGGLYCPNCGATKEGKSWEILQR